MATRHRGGAAATDPDRDRRIQAMVDQGIAATTATRSARKAPRTPRPDTPAPAPQTPAANGTARYALPADDSLWSIPVELIEPDPANARLSYDSDALAELAESIEELGILEPLIVRPHPDNSTDRPPRYRIVAGHRRWRAAQLAGLDVVPAILKTAPTPAAADLDAALVQLAENLHRADLDPVEEARGYQHLVELGLSQAEIARRVRKAPPTISNRLRLLALPDGVRQRLQAGTLSAAHGVALARFADFPAVAERIADLAASQHTPAKQLEKGLPFDWQPGHPLIRGLHRFNAVFDTAVCRKCPFGAKFGDYCLKPDHYDELQAAARDEIQRKAEADRAAVIAAQAALKIKTDPAPDAPAGPAAQPAPITLDTFHGAAYRQVGSPPPDGCSDDCRCRAAGLDYRKRTVPICLDPERFDRLAAAHTLRRREAAERLQADTIARTNAHLDRLKAAGTKELAIITARLLATVGSDNARNHLVARHAPDVSGLLPPPDGYYPTAEQMATLAAALRHALDGQLLRLALAAVLHEEQSRMDRNRDGAPLTSWYLDDIPPGIKAPPLIEQLDDPADSHPLDQAEDWTCTGCGAVPDADCDPRCPELIGGAS